MSGSLRVPLVARRAMAPRTANRAREARRGPSMVDDAGDTVARPAGNAPAAAPVAGFADSGPVTGDGPGADVADAAVSVGPDEPAAAAAAAGEAAGLRAERGAVGAFGAAVAPPDGGRGAG